MHESPTACPFCGSATIAINEIEFGLWAVCCEHCGATGPTSAGAAAAIAAWNHSAPPAERPALPEHAV